MELNAQELERELAGHKMKLAECMMRLYAINKEHENLERTISEESAVIQTLEFVLKSQSRKCAPPIGKDGKNETPNNSTPS